MSRQPESLPIDLLRRWHRWASASTRTADTLLQDFDALVSKLSPRLRAAVVVMARNAVADAQVWSSPRVDAAAARRARARLLELLAADPTRWYGPERVQLNERGNRIGESNPMAEVRDHDVELCLQLRDEGYSLEWLARKFEVHKATVQGWCNGRRRGQVPARVKQVNAPATPTPVVRSGELLRGLEDVDGIQGVQPAGAYFAARRRPKQ